MSKPCPYCGKGPSLADSKEVYGKSYGPIWICRDCNAYVGCHRGTCRPLGTLANEETREARKRAHAAFDPLWRGKFMGRNQAYRALAKKLGIEKKDCHIGMLDAETCRRVVAVVADIRAERMEAVER